MRQDHIGLTLSAQTSEILFDLAADIREEAVSEIIDDDLRRFGLVKELIGTLSSFVRTFTFGAEYHPSNGSVLVRFEYLQDRATATDLYVIRMRTNAEQVQRRIIFFRKGKIDQVEIG
jgi:hypothetical protein